MVEKTLAFLEKAPDLRGLALAVGRAGPAPYTGGLWGAGVTVLEERRDLVGGVTLRCRAEFTLRLVLPGDTPGENARRLAGLERWAAAMSAARQGPTYGNTDTERESFRAEQARLERADADGTVRYTVRLRAEFRYKFTEE